MQAVVITKPGGPEVLEIRALPIPEPETTEVLVRVHASALNRADLLQRRGLYPAPPGAHPDIPGLEFSGQAEAVGSAVRLWEPGQRVMGLTGGGAQAEYLIAHERTLCEIPENLSWQQAAAIPEAFITAHDALWVQAGLRASERVLIHAVGSGVGLAGLQLSRALNAIPFGTSRTADKLERAKEFGLEDGFLVPNPPVADTAKKWSATGGFDVVLDLVGGEYTNASLHALAVRGRIMLIGSMGGSKSGIDLGLMLGKRARMIGSMLRARPLEEKIDVTRRFARELVPLFAHGLLKPVIDSCFPLTSIHEAHQRMESNQTFGKVVVQMNN